jgi:hypothetical protein
MRREVKGLRRRSLSTVFGPWPHCRMDVIGLAFLVPDPFHGLRTVAPLKLEPLQGAIEDAFHPFHGLRTVAPLKPKATPPD